MRWGPMAVSLVAILSGAVRPLEAGERPDPDQTAAYVDRLFEQTYGADVWRDPASETVYLRRVFLDIIGQPPTPDDVLAYLADDRPDKSKRVVDRLLADPAFGTNWARYWRDAILARRTEPRALFVARPVERFLSEAFNQGEAWDAIVRQFIVAKGDVRENGATAVIMAQGGRPEGTVSELCRLFCGIQIQCAQCHDHPTDEWKREQFHQLAAFFPRVAARPTRGEVRSFLVTVTDFEFRRRRRRNPNNRFRGTLEHRMPDLDAPTKPGTLMTPTFFINSKSVEIGTPDAQRRESLARWMTSPENPWFAKAYVNRMWMELVGHGFYEPVDDMGPQREVRAGEVLEYLANAFVASGHDTKWLIRVITRTKAYRQQSVALEGCGDCTPAVASPQRLRADQLFTAISVAVDRDLDFSRRPANPQAPFPRSPRTNFARTFGYDPSDPREEITGSIAQVLAIMNSRPLQGLFTPQNPRSFLGQLMRTYPNDDRSIIREIYLRTLSRFPTAREESVALRAVRGAPDRAAGLTDIAWVLVNSTEFLYRR